MLLLALTSTSSEDDEYGLKSTYSSAMSDEH